MNNKIKQWTIFWHISMNKVIYNGKSFKDYYNENNYKRTECT